MSGKGLFICRMSDFDLSNLATSLAGDLVQQKIIIDSCKILGNSNFTYLAMSPNPSWPTGKFLIKGHKKSNGIYVGYINLPIVKNIIMMLYVIYFSFLIRPKFIYQYNSYFFENIGILCSSFLIRAKNFIIMQDYRDGSSFSFYAKTFDKISNKTVKYFDYCVPVTEKFSKHLQLPNKKRRIFIGGITQPAYECIESDCYEDNYAVFAGALEAYNGIDILISSWSKLDKNINLHVFGRGSLANLVEEYSKISANIIYHGFVDPSEVISWQKKAKFNICLRYSIGLDQEFFFPSKFFNVACCYGLMIVNDFSNLPEFFKNSQGLVFDDLSNLKKILDVDDSVIESEALKRRESIISLNNWECTLRDIFILLS